MMLGRSLSGRRQERIRRRRQRCKIDDEVRYPTKWWLTLDMLDEAISDWGLSARPVVADTGYGGITEFVAR